MSEFTSEQIAQIQEAISGLPPEEQEERAQELISQMRPVPQCPFCLMAQGKISPTKVYEDEKYLAVLEINPANPGHILLFCKRHVATFVDLSQEEAADLAKLAQVLLKSLHHLYPSFQIHADNGDFAGQRFPHFVLQLIPRISGDKVKFFWEPLKSTSEELAKIKEAIYTHLPQEESSPVPSETIIALPFRKRIP